MQIKIKTDANKQPKQNVCFFDKDFKFRGFTDAIRPASRWTTDMINYQKDFRVAYVVIGNIDKLYKFYQLRHNRIYETLKDCSSEFGIYAAYSLKERKWVKI